jgi:hypothetical protein
MSRLFSRLENKGYEQSEGAPPASPAQHAEPHAVGAFPAPLDSSSGSEAPTPAAVRPPAMPSLLPGYTISSSLGMALPPGPAVARSAWPVRLWLASLLLLVGLSLLMFALPERPAPVAAQKPPPSAASEPNAPAATPPAARNPSVPSASAVVPAAPAPRAPQAEKRRPAPASVPAAPVPSGGSSACNEAMLAMNLCSKPSP